MVASTGTSSFAPAAAGAASGACQVLAEHPLDSLKIRLQSRLVAFEGVGGPLAMLRHTVRGEGAAALLQGLAPRLLTYSAVKLSLFSLYERSLVLCNGSPAAAGALAGAANTVLSCPQDILKSRLQVVRALGPAACPSPITLARQLVRHHGPLVFYRGWSALVVRDTLGYAALFSIFEASRQRQLPTWLTGGLAGVCFYVSTLPIDRAKTIVMTQPIETTAAGAGGGWPAWRAAVDVVRSEGWRGLYRGCSVTLLRTFVGQSVGLSVYAAALRTLS